MSEAKRAAVRKFLALVETPPSGRGPEFERKLNDLVYTMNELGLWPDPDTRLSPETVRAAWHVFARLLRPGTLPDNLKM